MYKLLIVDDESLEREALRYFVEQSNLEIDTIIECATGTDTVKKVMLEKPDIIIMDINMPGLNGLEAMERIQLVHYNCKVIFSTAYNYFEYAVQALKLGAMDFLVKPVNKQQLITVLNKAIDQLDADLEQKSQSIRIKNMMEVMGKRIIGELICGNITDEVIYYLAVLGIDTVCCGNCFYLRIKSKYNEEQKQKVVQEIKQEFTLMGFHIIVNWKNRAFTLIILNGADMTKETVPIMKDLLFNLLKKNDLDYIAGIGIPFEDICQIEQSYNYARGMVGDVSLETIEEANDTEDIPVNIKKVCDFIDENYSQKISLDDIAKAVGYSKYHIGRLFKQHMGTTIVDYLIQIRIGKAKELLKQGTHSIKQISDMIGYSDSNYFTWSFKKIEGMSPVKYRYSKQET